MVLEYILNAFALNFFFYAFRVMPKKYWKDTFVIEIFLLVRDVTYKCTKKK